MSSTFLYEKGKFGVQTFWLEDDRYNPLATAARLVYPPYAFVLE